MNTLQNKHKPYGPYERFVKRPLDFLCSLLALIVLSPVMIILTVIGAIVMKGNPFFIQLRPGKIGKNGNIYLLKKIYSNI